MLILYRYSKLKGMIFNISSRCNGKKVITNNKKISIGEKSQ